MESKNELESKETEVMGSNENKASDTDNKKNDKSKKRKTIWVLIILLLIIFLLLLIRSCSNSDIQNGSLDYQNEKEVNEYLNEKADASNFIILANTNITVKDSEADIMVENSKENEFACVIDVFIDDTKVYTSDKMKPGNYIERVKIDCENMEKGVHNGTTVFKVLNQDGSLRSNMSVETTVTIK